MLMLMKRNALKEAKHLRCYSEVLKLPRYASAAPFPSPSLSRLQSGETEPPLPPLLRRARARSPPHPCPPNLAHRSALNPSISSTSKLCQSCEGKAALPYPPPSASSVSRRSTTVVVVVLL
jgi:hypothetical protein